MAYLGQDLIKAKDLVTFHMLHVIDRCLYRCPHSWFFLTISALLILTVGETCVT